MSKECTVVELSNLGQRAFCLTLDIEQDFGARLTEPSYEALRHIPDLVDFLKKRDISLTCFVQGSILETHPAEIEQLSALDVEYELHSYSHPSPQTLNMKIEIERGKKAYSDFFHKDPLGHRSPLGVINQADYTILASSGFKFDSSIFPSLRPGTFSNLMKPTTPYLLYETNIVEFPFTVLSRVIRVPIALSYIKLLGRPYLNLLKTARCPSLIVFDFHLHDLFTLSSSRNIPTKNLSFLDRKIFQKIYQEGIDGLRILDELISTFLKKGFVFLKLEDVYRRICE